MRLFSPRQPSLSTPRRRLFATVCVLAPLVAVAAVELLLRHVGLGGYPPVLRVVEETPQGTLMISDPAGTRGFFFANPDRPGYVNQYAFQLPKASNTVRIVLAGGSAIKGFPQIRCFAAGSFLREMLSDCWPDRSVEVINLGTTAVASFPVREIVKQALDCQPDLLVLYTGHNEFYGAYGVASLNRAAAGPRRLALQYRLRGLALVQGVNGLVHHLRGPRTQPLMEVMVGQDYLAPEDGKRRAAADLLYHHVGSMIRMCRERGVPVLVCSLPSNERDLAPMGKDAAEPDADAGGAAGGHRLSADPGPAVADLTALLEHRPNHARAQYLLGRALFAAGDHARAHLHFVRARDLDPMPWRATTQSQQAILRAANDHGGQWCDVETAFRRTSPGGSIGWELMDDHVHPTLQGQALLARTLVDALTARTDSLHVSRARFDALPDWTVYAERLGDNDYDRYGVAWTLRLLFNISFMRESNPDAFLRFERITRDQESRMTAEILAIAREWQHLPPQAGGRRPLTGMVARELLRTGRLDEAMGLFAVAMRSVPLYTSWHVEYTYFWLACRERRQRRLEPAELQIAADEIARGALLLRRGYTASGQTERYLGRLHQLRGEFAEAIPYLAAARTRLTSFDRVAADQALVASYLHTGDAGRAREIAAHGLREGGAFADVYRQMLVSVPDNP